MSENDGKIHTVYMRDPLKIISRKISHTKKPIYMGESGGASLALVATWLLSRTLFYMGGSP